MPITSSDKIFRGILAAVVPLSMVQNDIKAYFLNGGDQDFLVVSTDGKIVTNVNTIPISGPSVFDSHFQNVFTSGTKDVAAESFRLMTQGKSGVFEFTRQSDGQSELMAYEPIKFMGNNYWTLASTSQLQDAKSFTTALQSQGIFILVAIILIGAVAANFAALIIIFNRSLCKVVQEQDLRIHHQLDDLQKAYGKLIEQDMLKDEFINIAAHERRIPVLPIILSAEGLAEDIGTGDPKVDIILRNAKSIN